MASKVDLLKRERDDLRKLADHWKIQYDEYKGLNARLCAEVDAAAEMLREVKTQNAALRAENEKLRAALRQIAGIDVWDNSDQGYVDKARAALTQETRDE
jgi:transposase-like protein